MRGLYVAAVTWTGLGLASGLFYREFTKRNGFTGDTQLAVAHTHLLVLGTMVFLILLPLVRVFELDADRRFRWFVRVWNVGLALTGIGLVGKGVLQVLGHPLATSPAIAGGSGLGHMLLTVAFVFLFLVLRRRVWAATAERQDRHHAGAAVDPSAGVARA